MSFSIQNAAIGAALSSGQWDGMPGNRYSLADQLATSAILTFNAPVRSVRAFIWQKGFSVGTGTLGTSYSLQVADNANFTSNIREVASGFMFRGNGTKVLSGVVPDNFLATWCKLVVTSSGTDILTYDVTIDAS